MTNSPDGIPPLTRPLPVQPPSVDEVAKAHDGPPVTNPTPETATHHGEALVAALLNTGRDHQSPAAPADGSAVTEPGRTAPLTASSILSNTTDDGLRSTESVGGVSSDSPARPRVLSEMIQDGRVKSETPPDTQVSDEGGGGVGDDADSEDDQSDSDDKQTAVRNVLEWIVVLGAAVAVAIILRTFVFQAFYIPSESMETTLFKDDRLLVNKVSYRMHDVNRGDVVVFRRPDDQPGTIRDLIKRVIGLPGDTVEGRDGIIYINGQQLVEPYLDGNPFGDFSPVTVPEGEFFMMGDNRDESLDSRRFGTISEDRIIGRAFVLFWPFDRVGTL